ncbi:MAG: DUF1294 domain-containing protein [Phycisphaerae bacterium]
MPLPPRRHHPRRTFALLAIVAVLVSGVAGTAWLGRQWWWAAALAGMNLSAAILYAYDKWASSRCRARVPEIVLQVVALLGGSPAALLCRWTLRHKTRKLSFRLTFWAIVLIQLTAVAAVWYALTT